MFNISKNMTPGLFKGYFRDAFFLFLHVIVFPLVFLKVIIEMPKKQMRYGMMAIITKGYEPSEKLKKELQNHVKKETAPYKYPKIIEFVNELPKTISEKIRRVDIRNEDKDKK
ncbi:benzoate--CoA ligase [Methanobrevibacter cuticularis]|uniref:Benzoate--CoA ligase n=1 Tax=Methanobrevibacter cuticularis TaxID=47311 RepID=A0A166E5S0_9EURY|nr:benzoate--CoA ligase [Methanobrevibacter cuticularis]